jgi:hypothetical protein
MGADGCGPSLVLGGLMGVDPAAALVFNNKSYPLDVDDPSEVKRWRAFTLRRSIADLSCMRPEYSSRLLNSSL